MIANQIAGLLTGGVVAALTDYESIATVTVGGAGASSVSFTGISGSYSHLQIRCIAKSSLAGSGTSLGVQFNSNTSGYFNHGLYGDGTVGAYATTSSNNAGSAFIAASSVANVFGATVIDVLDYASTNKNKTFRILSGADYNSGGQLRFASGSLASTTAITSLNFLDLNGGNFTQYTQFALYGIK
jgi:hypothetical protein